MTPQHAGYSCRRFAEEIAIVDDPVALGNIQLRPDCISFTTDTFRCVQSAFRIIAVVVYQITGNPFSTLTMPFNKLFVMRCGDVRSLVQI